MLSEERIRELLDEHLPKAGEFKEKLLSFPMAFGLAVAAESAAAEREWLMEEVCTLCGNPCRIERFGIDQCDECGGAVSVTRAEYLRLRTEST